MVAVVVRSRASATRSFFIIPLLQSPHLSSRGAHMRGRGGPLPSVARPVPHAAQAQSHPRGEHGRSLSQWHRRYLCDGAAGCGRCPSRPCPAAWTNVSREVGGLSPADAAPPKPVALAVTTVPDGD